MKHEPVLTTRSPLSRRTTLPGIVLAIAALAAAPAWAVVIGPANPPPGGVTGTSSDSGAGEDIGRAGGVTWSFSDLDFNFYTSLYYGPAGTETLGFAMDGAIDEENEWMVFNADHSDLGAGVLAFTGSTKYLSRCQNYYVRYTRLTVVFDGDVGTPVAGTSVGRPDLEFLVPVNGDFSVNLLIEASNSSSPLATWHPALDDFDNLNSCYWQGTRTDVTTAFFYERDAHPAILDALAVIEAKLDEGDPRIDEILGRVTTIDDRTLAILGNVSSVISMTEFLEAKLDQLPNDLEQLKGEHEMLLKIAAERVLLEGKRVAIIYLPIEHGGLLEHVKSIVEEKIGLVEDSGESANAARYYLNRGDSELNFERFKRAYDNYARAYCEAVKLLGERCPQ